MGLKKGRKRGINRITFNLGHVVYESLLYLVLLGQDALQRMSLLGGSSKHIYTKKSNVNRKTSKWSALKRRRIRPNKG